MRNFITLLNGKQDLLTKFYYKNLFQLPKIEKISLTFTVTSSSLKSVLPCLSALTLISSQKACLFPIKKTKIFLKMKTGSLIRCQVDLRGKQKYSFLLSFVMLLSPQLKDFQGFSVNGRSVFFRIENLFIFKTIEKEYEHFPDLPSLSGNIFLKASSPIEVGAFLSCFSIPLKKNG